MSGTGGRRRWLILGGIVLLAVVVRAPAVMRGGRLEGSEAPVVRGDEKHHYRIGIAYLDRDSTEKPKHYFKGMGIQMVGMARAGCRLVRLVMGPSSRESGPDEWGAIVTGRVLSVVYAALTVLVIYFLTARWLGPGRAALAALLLALCNLHVTQSHFAVAGVPGTFWLYLSLFLMVVFLEKESMWLLGLAAVATGIAFGTKYLGMAIVPAVVLALRGRRRALGFVIVVAGAASGFFLANGFDVSRELVSGVMDMFVRDNIELGFQRSRAWNFLVYPVQLMVGMSLAAFIPAVAAVVRALKRPAFLREPASLVIIGPLVIYSGVILAYDISFERHLVPLVPAACMAAAVVLAPRERGPGGRRAVIAAACSAYCLLAVISAERPFIMDPCREYLAWLKREVPEGTLVGSDDYVPVSRLRYRWRPLYGRRVDVIVLHEAEAFRYLRSPISPVRPPGNRNIFHRDRATSRFVQGLLGIGPPERANGFRPVVRFERRPLVPEAVLYEKLWGSYNVIAGWITVFSRETD